MPGEQLLLDPTSEGTGTQLDITDSTLGYFLMSHEYPDPDPDIVQASSIDTEGANPVAGKHQPRTITIVVRCVQPTGGSPSIGTMVSNLQRKVGKLFREGGTCRRVLPSGDTITFDVLRFGARIQVPADKRWLVRGTADVTITLTCDPYGRGASTSATLSGGSGTATTITATNTKAPFVFTTSSVKGDIPARGFLKLGNVTNIKTAAIWGVQNRYYDSLTSLLLEAENGQASNAALNAGSSGASGAGANKVMRHLDVGTAGAESYVVRESTGGLSHTGTFRVYARVQALSTNTGIVSTQLWWKPNAFQNDYITNDWVPIQTAAGAAIKGSWVLVDLGLVTIPPALRNVGFRPWSASLYAKSTVATDDIDFDWVALIPAEEGFGRLNAPISGIDSSGSAGVEFAHDLAQIVTLGGFYFEPSSYEGDMLTVPPSGAEARTTRFIALLTGAAAGNLTDTVIDAANFDAITATLTITPRYLSVPAP